MQPVEIAHMGHSFRELLPGILVPVRSWVRASLAFPKSCWSHTPNVMHWRDECSCVLLFGDVVACEETIFSGESYPCRKSSVLNRQQRS